MLFKELLLSNLRRIPRNKGLLFATLFFPLIFIGVFGIAFQQGGIGTSPTDIAIFRLDSGVPEGATVFNHAGEIVNETDLQTSFVELLQDLTYEDNETRIFNINFYDLDEQDSAHKLLEQGEIDAILTIPKDFSLGVMASFRSSFGNDLNLTFATQNWRNYPSTGFQSELNLLGDQTRQNFGIVATVIAQVSDVYFDFSQNIDNVVVEIDGSIATDSFTFFDYILPGLVIFGIMQSLAVIAVSSLRDVESGLLDRLKISSLHSVEYLGAVIASQLVVSIVQVPIFFLVAAIFGFPLTVQVLYAFIFALLVSLSMTGLGLMIAGTVETTDSANTISSMVGIPMAFLAGAFFQVPNPTIIENFFGYELRVMDLLPPTPAIEGLRLILIGGRGLEEVTYQLVMLGSLTLILLVLGISLYAKKHFIATH